MPLDIVLDTNVIFAALYSREGPSFRLLEMIGDKTFRIHLSVALMFQYEDVAKRNIAQFRIDEPTIDTEDYLKIRAARGSRKKFERALAKIPARKPLKGDEFQQVPNDDAPKKVYSRIGPSHLDARPTCTLIVPASIQPFHEELPCQASIPISRKTMGNTPLVKINRIVPPGGATVLVKCEFFNPLGSVKDRIGMAMIEAGEKAGKITKETHIYEATSGNTGIALAFVCASKGYKLTLTMPETMSIERRRLLRILGANLVLTPGAEGMKGCDQQVQRTACGKSQLGDCQPI